MDGRSCLPCDSIWVVEFAEVNRVGEGGEDGPGVERGHGSDHVLCECVLKRREQNENSAFKEVP